MKLSRREMIQATAAAMALPALPQARGPRPEPQFFTEAEFALVDELSELIIPADAQSGGARAAGVAAFIDGRLAEAFEPEDAGSPSPGGRGGQGERTRWRTGLQAVEDLSRELHGKAFMESAPAQRLALLTRMAAAEADPKTPAERFFGEIKGATIRAYYSSKVGIHDDQRYKGNVYQTGDYAGSDPT